MSTSNDPVAAFVLALLAMVVVLPVVAVWCAVVVVGRSAFWLARSGRQLVQGSPVERELGRITSEKYAAITDIVSLRNEAERQMRGVADGRVIEVPPRSGGHE
jgi:hypothetical protein